MSASGTLVCTVMVSRSASVSITGVICTAITVCPTCTGRLTTVPSIGAVMRV